MGARLADPAPSVRWAALEALGRVGRSAAPSAGLVVARLDDVDPGVRRAASRAAGRIGVAASEALLARLDRSEDESRALVKAALLAMAPALAERVPELARRLRGDDATLSEDAADVLVAVGPAAVPAIATAVDDERALVAVTAAHALGRLGEAAGATGALALERALARRGDVRVTALDALVAMGAAGRAALERAAASEDAALAAAARERGAKASGGK